MKSLSRFIFVITVIFVSVSNLYAKKYVAFSLKMAQNMITSVSKEKDFRKIYSDLFRLYGITVIKGAVYDNKKKDLIIIGYKDPEKATLTLDDLVVAFRSILIYGKEPTINLILKKNKGIQTVHFDGGIENTRFGKAFFDVTIKLKYIGISVLDDDSNLLNFWLLPTVPIVWVKKDVIVISGFKQNIFTSDEDEKTTNKLKKEIDDKFISILAGLAQLIALAKGIERMNKSPDLWYWLKDYKIKPISTPKNIQVTNNLYDLSCGIHPVIAVFDFKNKGIKELKKAILKKRPKEESVVWNFNIKKNLSLCLSKDVEDMIDLFSKAVFLYKIKRSFYQAIDLYTKIIKMNSKWNMPYYARGNVYNELRQYEKAIKDYTKAIEINSHFPMAYISRGHSYNHIGKYKDAIKDFNKAIEISPYHIDAYNNRGIAYCGIEEYEKGIEDFNNAVRIDPRFTFAYVNRGKARFCLGQYKIALRDLNKAIEIDPDFAEAYCNRGIVHRYLEEYDKAIEDFNRTISIDPNYAYAYIQRGLTYEDLCQWKKADNDIKKAVELEPAIFSIYIYAAIKLNPKTAVEYHERGHAYFCLGQWKKAIEDFDKAIQLKSKFAAAYFYRGLSYDNLKNYKNAIMDYSKAIELIPNDAIMYNNRGTAYYSSGEYEKALKDFSKAIELDPTNPLFYENRVRVYLRLGKNKEACEDAFHTCKLGRCRIYKLLIKRGICKQPFEKQLIKKGN